jgi:diaminohydroxyphosphoribosylaminopyrimidine deaminase/5-amino-6-(5-phosphoribosylamino)uracil reductase
VSGVNQNQSNFSADDYRYMQRAISLAKKGHYTTSPNPRVGCVIVKNNKIVGEGYHQKVGEGHAEVHALAQAGSNAQGSTAYVTLEPCSHYGRTPPCAEALVKAKVDTVIIAMTDPNPQVSGRGIALLEKAGISVKINLLQADAQALNPGFIHLMINKRPYVRCKLAASLDGKTAMKSGESKWITSPEARYDVQRLRAQSCAVITGADSVLTDNAKMTVRWHELGISQENYPQARLRQPTRIIIDSQNRLTPNLALFEHSSEVILLRTSIEKSHTWPHFVKQVVLPSAKQDSDKSYVDLDAALDFIAQQGFNDVLIESGATLAGAFLSAGLIDELILYQAPKLLGSDAKSLVNMPKLNVLNDAVNLKINDIRMVGKDIRIIANINKS